MLGDVWEGMCGRGCVGRAMHRNMGRRNDQHHSLPVSMRRDLIFAALCGCMLLLVGGSNAMYTGIASCDSTPVLPAAVAVDLLSHGLILKSWTFPRHSPEYDLVKTMGDIKVETAPRAPSTAFDWKGVNAALSRSGVLHLPGLHARALSSACPMDITRNYILHQLNTTQDWDEEWSSHHQEYPIYTPDCPSRVSAFDMLLVLGSPDQLRMVLTEYDHLVRAYLTRARTFEHRSPYKVLAGAAIIHPIRYAEKMMILEEYFSSILADDDTEFDHDDDTDIDDDDGYVDTICTAECVRL